MFVRVILAHYGVIYVTFSTTPYKIIDILFYYTSREFPIQNFHRRTTDILYCYMTGENPVS